MKQADLFGHQLNRCAATPTRTALYSLQLAGNDGESQEGLLDYVHRLSVEHCVRVRHLLAEVILPEARITGAFFIPGHFSAHSLQGCQGWSGYAQSFLGALTRLTGRADLANGAMTRWASLLDPRGYAARVKRWCAICMRERYERGTVHFSLSWAFEEVQVCPRHLCRLTSVCGRCGHKQPIIGDALSFGRCCTCSAWLHEASDQPAKTDDPALFRARAVMEMIGAGISAEEFASPDICSTRFQAIADAHTNGSLLKLEQRLGLSYAALRTRSKHRLPFLLEVLYRLGTSPIAFLSGGSIALSPTSEKLQSFRMQRNMPQCEVVAARARLLIKVQEALQKPDVVTTRLQILRDAQITCGMLRHHFADLQAVLSAHNAAARPLARARLWALRKNRIEAIILDIVDRGGCLSHRSINTALRADGLFPGDTRIRRIVRDVVELTLADGATGNGVHAPGGDQ